MSDVVSICIIEDSPPINKLFGTILKKDGYHISQFKTGIDALNWLKDNKPNLILMDILLPDYSGTELINLIKDLDGFENTKFVAVTGFTDASDKEKYIKLGFNAFLSKPVNVAEFPKQIKSILNQ